MYGTNRYRIRLLNEKWRVGCFDWVFKKLVIMMSWDCTLMKTQRRLVIFLPIQGKAMRYGEIVKKQSAIYEALRVTSPTQ